MEVFKKFWEKLQQSELIEWNPTIGFMSCDDIYDLADSNGEYKGDPYYLPMHGMNIMWVDNEIKRIITEFNPKYICNAGEDSFIQMNGYPKGELLYRYKDHHEVPKLSGIPTEIIKFKIKDHYGLFIGQCELNGNMSVILLSEHDDVVAKLLHIETTFNRGYRNNPIEQGAMEIAEFIYKNCLGIEFKD